jgi:dihydroorotate dehydrogenase electron transfer subunit
MSDAGNSPRAWHVLIGTDAGYSSLVQAALRRRDNETSRLLVFFGVEDAFAFRPRPSTILVPGMPAGVIASIPVLEEVGIASRLASTAGLPGCHDGTVTELVELWLRSLASDVFEQVHIAVDNSDAKSSAVKELGRLFQIPVINIHGSEAP